MCVTPLTLPEIQAAALAASQAPAHSLPFDEACILLRRSDGRWKCARRRCGYVTKKDSYDVAPMRFGCKGGGPGTMLSQVLAFIGVTEESYLRFRRRFDRDFNSCGCKKKSRELDRFWYVSRWTAPIRKYLENYSTNIKLLIRKLKGTVSRL